jgi:DNA-binding beta-propeller fold protein YncE
LRRIFAAALAAVLLGAGPRPIVFSAPAVNRPAGAPNPSRPFDTILPNGRIVAPFGTSVAVGGGARAVALTPDGRYAIVASDGLDVVDTSSMRVVATQPLDGGHAPAGVVAFRDPADPARTIVLATGGSDTVEVFDLGTGGTLTAEPASIAVQTADGARLATLALSPDGRTAYVLDRAGSVASIDLLSRRTIDSAPVGFFPSGVASAGNRLYVTNAGVMEYRALSRPVRIPQFGVAPFDPERASSLGAFGVAVGGGIDAASAQTAQMDPAPDELTNIGGARPGAIALSKDGRYAFVCMENVDRIAVVALDGVPRVVGGKSLRLFEGSAIGSSPYGMRPSAIVRSRSGDRLYVALTGINAVAVLDSSKPPSLKRLGLLPTGWAPDAVALSSDDRTLYVGNARGNALSATLQRIDLRRIPLKPVTLSALRYNRSATYGKNQTLIPPMRLSAPARSAAIAHVVEIHVGFGAYGSSDAANASPNLHALAHTYGFATNFYVVSDASAAGLDPDDYPRSGYLFNNLQRAGRSYRDYGGLLRLAGYDDGASRNPRDDDPDGTGASDAVSPTSGLGGSYSLEVPALAALTAHVDLDYPGWNPRIRDERRAREFVRDFAPLVQNDAMPDYTYVGLPGTDPAAGDKALGMIVDYLSHSPQWSSTAVFITGGDDSTANAGFAVVVSPYTARGYVGHANLSSASVLKTEEEVLGLPPLQLDDLLATDMSDFFTSKADPSPFSNL